MQKAYQFSAHSYIVKPVDLDKFIEVAAQVELYWRLLNQSLPSGVVGEN